MGRNKKRAALILLCAGVIGLIVCAVGVGTYYYSRWRERAYYESLAGSYAPSDSLWDDPVPGGE